MPIHPAFLEGYSPAGADEKVSLKDEKVALSEEKAALETRKAALDGEKVSLVTEKAALGSTAIGTILDKFELTKPTRGHIVALLEEFGFETSFTRLKVRNVLKLERTGATRLLAKMLEMGIIYSASNEGRGKYRFKVPIPNSNTPNS